MKENTEFIAVFGSTDDPFIPWSEMQQVIDNLNPELHKFDDEGHFQQDKYPKILQAVKDHLT